MDQPRLDWRAIGRSVLIIVLSAALFAFVVPIVGALAIDSWDTLNITGSEIYRWLFWIVAWVVIFVQGSWMLRHVHEAIVNDLLVVTAIADVLLFALKFIVWLVFWPISEEGVRLFAITGIDVFGAVGAILIAFVAARVNQY